MPWRVTKVGSQYVVVKKGTGAPVPGGSHGSRKDAVKHMQALYVNVSDAKRHPKGH
jgi:hypothetical protein